MNTTTCRSNWPAVGACICVAAFLALTIIAQAAATFCDSNEANVLEGASSHKLCIAKHFPEFVDYHFNIPSCTVRITMTRIEDVARLEEAIRPGFSEFTHGLPSPPCSKDGSAIFRFRQSDAYPYGQLFEWAQVAEPRIRAANPEQHLGMLLMDGKLHLHFHTDAAASRATEILRDVGIPQDACEVTSRETEIRNIPSIAPLVRIVQGGEQLMLPVLLPSNELAGHLVLGVTTVDEAVAILPPVWGPGPVKQSRSVKSARAPWVSSEIHKTLDDVRITYMAPAGHIFMGFDKAKYLIVAIYEVQEGQESSLLEGIDKLAAPKLVHESERQRTHRGAIGSCVIVEATSVPTDGERFQVSRAAYFYVCPRKRQ